MLNENTQAFGVDFYTGSKADLLKIIRDAMEQPYSYIVTPNVDHLAQLQDSEPFRRAYAKARLRVCDSRVLLPLLQSLGIPVQEVIPGSDLTVDLLRLAQAEGLKLVLIGSSDDECALLRKRFPGIELHHYNPPMGFINNPEEVERCLAFIREHPSHLVFYAVGAPRQELLASQVKSHERNGIGLCIGASIAFATGTVKRAPAWMQNARLEWLHRLSTEPRRLGKRYLQDLFYIIPAYWRERSQKLPIRPAEQDH